MQDGDDFVNSHWQVLLVSTLPWPISSCAPVESVVWLVAQRFAVFGTPDGELHPTMDSPYTGIWYVIIEKDLRSLKRNLLAMIENCSNLINDSWIS